MAITKQKKSTLNMKKTIFTLLLALLASLHLSAQTDSVMVRFDFATASDLSGKYQGTLCQGATLDQYAGENVLSLGTDNGYFDFGSSFGAFIRSLSTNFTISVNVFVPEETNLTANGNFIWCFAHSSSEGYMFLNAKDTRYAISPSDYTEESGVTARSQLKKGEWNNLILVQNGQSARLYLNGISSSKQVRLHPSDLSELVENYLGRSCYAGDAYLRGALIHDFRVYNYSLLSSGISELSRSIKPLNAYADSLRICQQMDEFTLGDVSQLKDDIDLPSTYKELHITWESSDNGVITAEGRVTRPVAGSGIAHAVLTAHLTAGTLAKDREFTVGVLPELSDAETVDMDAEGLRIPGHPNNVYTDLTLPTVAENGSVVFWKSHDTDWIDDKGRVLQLPEGQKRQVVLTATLMKGQERRTRDFTVTLHEREPYTNYLFVYFPSNTNENLYYALSNDGYNFTPINNGQPVVKADTIALKKGVRDPHVLRGPDGMFYMVNTDMRSAEGWSSNRGLVLMKSADLINWQHSTVHFPDRYPGTMFAKVIRVWAPETIWDEEAQKFMVYFSLRTESRDGIPYDKDYYCYANADFTDLEGEPTYFYDRGSATIDMDIVYNESDSLYHGFYKNEGEGGICKVTARHLTARPGEPLGSQWSTPSGTLQQTTEAVEGAGVFKLINQDSWVLMYDCYSNGHYQFCSSSDLENFTFVQNTAMQGVFTPRHGTVLPITQEETAALLSAFPMNTNAALIAGARNPRIKQQGIVITHPATTGGEGTIYLPVEPGTDITSFDPQFYLSPVNGTVNSVPQDFSKGPVVYAAINNAYSSHSSTQPVNYYAVTVEPVGNPVLPDFHADPEVLFSKKTGRFYVYPTTDGYASWGGYSFDVFSSPDLLNFTNEGTFLNLKSGQDVAWASGNAWAPCIEEKWMNGKWRYFFYFSGNNVSLGKKTLGVAVSESPTGPFRASAKPLFTSSAAGQMIDSDVFTDPVSGQTYLYYGNGKLCYRLLSDDMMSTVGSEYVITPSGGSLSDYAFREGAYVFYRNGLYYFLWSVDDTGATNYHVAYGTSKAPTGPIEVARQPIVIIQDPDNRIYGTGHNSIINIPGTDDWYIVYHRINPNHLNNGPGTHREVCVDRLTFNADGTIRRVTPTNRGIDPVVIPNVEEMITGIHGIGQPESANWTGEATGVAYYTADGTRLGTQAPHQPGLYLRREVLPTGEVRTLKMVVK